MKSKKGKIEEIDSELASEEELEDEDLVEEGESEDYGEEVE